MTPLEVYTLHGFVADEVKAVCYFGLHLATYFTSQPAATLQELDLIFSGSCRIDSPMLDLRVVDSREIVGDISYG